MSQIPLASFSYSLFVSCQLQPTADCSWLAKKGRSLWCSEFVVCCCEPLLTTMHYFFHHSLLVQSWQNCWCDAHSHAIISGDTQVIRHWRQSYVPWCTIPGYTWLRDRLSAGGQLVGEDDTSVLLPTPSPATVVVTVITNWAGWRSWPYSPSSMSTMQFGSDIIITYYLCNSRVINVLKILQHYCFDTVVDKL